MEEIKIPSKANQRTQSNEIKDHFYFLGEMVSAKELNSILPFYNCDEIGHEANMWDSVCLDESCKFKGLACARCAF